MSMMTPVNKIPATSVRHPEADRAERLAACKTVVGEMLAESACALDVAAPGARAGLHLQSRLRMISAAMLLDEIDDIASDDIRATALQIRRDAGAIGSDAIRDIAERLDASFDIELHSIKIGILWDRYA